MTRRQILALAACGAIAPTAAGQMLNPARILPTREALGRMGLERAWFTAVPLQRGVEQILRVSFAGGTIFVHTSLAQFHAFDAETGRWLWSTEIGRPTRESQDVAVNTNFVFVTNAQKLYCLDRGTGRIVWDQLIETPVTSSPTATEELVMLGEMNGKIVAYSLVPSEEERYQRKVGPPGGFAWAYFTSGRITARPVATDQVVAFGSTSGKLYVARLDPKEVLHRSQPLGSVEGSMATYGTGPESTLLVPSTNGNLYSINLFTGEQNWIFSSGAPIRTEPLVGTYRPPAAGAADSGDHDSTLFILNDAGILHSVAAETGEPKWAPNGVRTGANRILAVGATSLYLQTEYGDLVEVDRASGSIVFSAAESQGRAGLDLRDYKLSVINDINDRIYLASGFGSLICLREMGALRPTPVRDPNEPAFGFIPTAVPGDVPASTTTEEMPDGGGSSSFEN